jgi:tRNA-binding EMAP/Myf-like protein
VCIPSLEDLCLLDAGVGLELHGYRIPSGLQRHYPGTTVLVVTVVVLQKAQVAALRPDVASKMIVLGLEVSGSDNSLENCWISSEVNAPYLCHAAWDGTATNLALVMPTIKTRYKEGLD